VNERVKLSKLVLFSEEEEEVIPTITAAVGVDLSFYYLLL